MTSNDGDNPYPGMSLAALRALQRAKRMSAETTRVQVGRPPRIDGPRSGHRGRADGLKRDGLNTDNLNRIVRLVDELVDEQGWSGAARQADIQRCWPQIVGPQIAEHARAGALRDGLLVIDTSSTAWATQLRILAPVLQERIDVRLGPGVVTGFDIRGPQAPSWRSGPRTVRGRGPRDTYG